MVKKPDSDDLPGNTDEECCEHESCLSWPEIFKEAEGGCGAASIHEDCPSHSALPFSRPYCSR